MSPPSLVFKVRRQEPELVSPADPTPRELKPLSDIDSQESLRFQLPILQFYKSHPSMHGKDPVKVIREALSRALVFYYPFAGRLREGPGGKLFVDCTGEGIIFVEADADVALSDFGDFPQPPFPCLDELLFDVPGSGGIIGCPLLLIQVTRLKCKGFVLAIRFTHNMTDGQGLVQFMTAVSEMARGAPTPSVMPIWNRELFSARDPPRATCTHPEYDEIEDNTITSPSKIEKSYFFSRSEISHLRRIVPQESTPCTTFELLTACCWRCRTVALGLSPEEEVRLLCIVNARDNRKTSSLVPIGYYGNAFAMPGVVTTVEKMVGSSIGYAVELVKAAKASFSEEYLRSTADLLVTRGRPRLVLRGSFGVSNVTHLGFVDVDFGWGKAVYGGPANSGGGVFHIAGKNQEGEEGILLLLCFPDAQTVEKFEEELNSIAQKTQLMQSSHDFKIKGKL